jgi:ParB/RepB/Spo0J family partition protein
LSTTNRRQEIIMNQDMKTAALPKADGAKPTTATAGTGVVKRGNAYFIDPQTVRVAPGWNPRFDFGEIDALAKSIKANGVLNPIRVRRIAPVALDNGLDAKNSQVYHFELIDGQRRLTAIQTLLKAGHVFDGGVPAIVVDKAQDEITSLIQMFEANSGKVFLPLEEAAAYKRMRDAGMTVKAICAAVGRKSVHVGETLALLDADAEVQEAVASGAIGKTQAKQIASKAKGDKAAQKALVAVAKTAKNKDGRKALGKALDAVKAANATKRGKTLKMRALGDDELSALGAAIAAKMVDRVRDAGMDLDTDIRAWVAKDDKLALAYTHGALEALKAAAGMKINLDI